MSDLKKSLIVCAGGDQTGFNYLMAGIFYRLSGAVAKIICVPAVLTMESISSLSFDDYKELILIGLYFPSSVEEEIFFGFLKSKGINVVFVSSRNYERWIWRSQKNNPGQIEFISRDEKSEKSLFDKLAEITESFYCKSDTHLGDLLISLEKLENGGTDEFLEYFRKIAWMSKFCSTKECELIIDYLKNPGQQSYDFSITEILINSYNQMILATESAVSEHFQLGSYGFVVVNIAGPSAEIEFPINDFVFDFFRETIKHDQLVSSIKEDCRFIVYFSNRLHLGRPLIAIESLRNNAVFFNLLVDSKLFLYLDHNFCLIYGNNLKNVLNEFSHCKWT